jgi:putative nucleotidyltransferase with HDIG domain
MVKTTALKIYMAVVILSGIGLTAWLMLLMPVSDMFGTVFFALLAVFAETQTVDLGAYRSISVSSAVVTASMLVCGPTAAVLTAAVCVLGSAAKINGKLRTVFNTKPEITLFNVGNYALSSGMMCLIYFGLRGSVVGPSSGLVWAMRDISLCAPQLVAGVVVSILFNSMIVGTYGAVKHGSSLRGFLGTGFVWPVMNVIIISILGALLTALYTVYGWFFVILFFLPFILARYTFSTYKELQANYLETIDALASAVEAKDVYTIGHSRRVEQYCDMIAGQMKLSQKRRETLRYAALLHDIGKISIPEAILNKPGRPTEEEWVYIKQHPVRGEKIIKDIEFLSEAAEIVRNHHERYDGSGYPDGKSAGQLSVEAMIIGVADAYDAMTSDRPYRKRMSHEEAMRELRDKSGTQFMPEAVEAFDRAVRKNGLPVKEPAAQEQ